MNDASIGSPTLDDVLKFNATLLSLHEAGVPIGLGAEFDSESLEKALGVINAQIAMSVARGSMVRQVLDSDCELPSLYRTSLKTWLYCGNSPDALGALSESGSSRRTQERVLRFSILNPLILLVLVYFGFLYLMLGVGPKMQAISLQIGSVPGMGLQFLIIARQYVLLFAIAGPVLIAIFLFAWNNQRWRSSERWLPGQKGISESLRNANYADAVSNHLEHKYSEEQTLASVGRLEVDARDERKKTELPPLLHWALGDDVTREDRVSALHFSARGYREIARNRSGKWRSWFPVLVGSLCGGTIVLAFGLSLFVPIIEILSALTRP